MQRSTHDDGTQRGQWDQVGSLRVLIHDRAEDSPDHAYLEDARSDRRVTYLGLSIAIDEWAAIFDALTVCPSGAVLIDIADPLSFAVVYLASVSTGRRAVPVDPGQPASEAARLGALLGGASLVVSDRDEDATIADVASARIDPNTFSPSAVRPGRIPTSARDAPGCGSVVLFTSGSTGTPKGVELPEKQLLTVAHAVAEHNALTARDRGFNSLPLFHVNAEVVGLLATIVAGATLVLDSRFRRTGFWELLAERRISWLNAVPAILAVLAKTGPLEVPDTLRFIRSASAPLPDSVRAALGDTPLILSWGMTEAASQITATPLGAAARQDTVGVPVRAEVEARGDDGATLPAGEVGPLWVRGPGIVRSYLFGRAADRFDEHGWLSTGDLGAVSVDGWVTLVGRSDDVINRGGEKVYPSEVEDVLLEDSRVLEAVVVARPDDILGSVPVAYVLPQTDAGADEEDLVRALYERCENELSRFRRPVEISIVADLPRAPTGKIQRARVRAMAASAH